MRKMTNLIQCGDLAMALEEGLAAIDVDLGSPFDLLTTNTHINPKISSSDLSVNLGEELKLALSARAEYTKAQISGDDDKIQHALFEAECCGYHSFKIGNDSPPILVKSIPALSAAWQTGWSAADFSEEMSEMDNYEEPWR